MVSAARRRGSLDDSSVPASARPTRPFARRAARVRRHGAGWTHTRRTLEGTVLIRYLAVLGLGYVLGTKAGRRRYEQIVGTYRALTSSPAAKSVIDGSRRRIANRVSPDARMVTLTEIDDTTAVVESQRPT